jgi:glycine cleavage system H lipoate-binding protein
MKQRIDFRLCTQDYHCGSCDFDQFFFDEFTVHASVRPVEVFRVEGYRIPHGYYCHRGHAWVKLEEGSMVTVGLDDFAHRVLGPVERIESPLLGKTVERDRGQITLVRGHRSARALCPVSGIVTAVNAETRENAKAAGHSPYEKGWIMRVHAPDLRTDLKGLLLGAETHAFLEGEIDRVQRLVEETAGPLAADGGMLADDLCSRMPELEWDRLSRLVLQGV